MDALVLVADAAQVDPAGKIHMLGGGWSVTGPAMPSHAVVVLVDIPWDLTDRPHTVVLELRDADGTVVLVPVEGGPPEPLRIVQEVQVSRPDDLPSGVELRVPVVVELSQGVPCVPGERYRWQVEVNGETRAHWSAGFFVRGE
jgi:hypothetical protein